VGPSWGRKHKGEVMNMFSFEIQNSVCGRDSPSKVTSSEIWHGAIGVLELGRKATLDKLHSGIGKRASHFQDSMGTRMCCGQVR